MALAAPDASDSEDEEEIDALLTDIGVEAWNLGRWCSGVQHPGEDTPPPPMLVLGSAGQVHMTDVAPKTQTARQAQPSAAKAGPLQPLSWAVALVVGLALLRVAASPGPWHRSAKEAAAQSPTPGHLTWGALMASLPGVPGVPGDLLANAPVLGRGSAGDVPASATEEESALAPRWLGGLMRRKAGQALVGEESHVPRSKLVRTVEVELNGDIHETAQVDGVAQGVAAALEKADRAPPRAVVERAAVGAAAALHEGSVPHRKLAEEVDRGVATGPKQGGASPRKLVSVHHDADSLVVAAPKILRLPLRPLPSRSSSLDALRSSNIEDSGLLGIDF